MTTDPGDVRVPHDGGTGSAAPTGGANLLDRVLGFSIRHRGLVLVAALALGALGVAAFQRLPIDAVPDITNVQVQVNTPVSALSPMEVESQVTFPVETALAGLPETVPGFAVVRPLPKWIEHGDPGGVNWTTRNTSPTTKSASSRQPRPP